MKRKVWIDLLITWVLWIGLFGLLILEHHVEAPWNRVTNGLWVATFIATAFFMFRGAYRLIRYEIERRK